MNDRPSLVAIRRFAAGHPLWFALAAYCLLTAAYFWPIVLQFRNGVPHDLGDSLLNTWIADWNLKTTPLTAAWWNAPAFWPLSGVMAYSEHLLGAMPLFGPLAWLGFGPQASYNLVLLVSWPLAATAAYLLAYQLTARHDVSFVGGLLFGFAPYRLDQISHLQVLLSFWMPAALFALHRFLAATTERAKIGWSILFGITWLLQALSNGYYLVYFSLLILVWIAWYRPPKAWRLASAWLCCALPLAPILTAYQTIHAQFQLSRGFGEIASFGADVASFLTAPDLLLLWPLHLERRPEQALYPGLVGPLILAAGVVLTYRNRSKSIASFRTPSWRGALVVVGCICIALGLYAAFAGGWSLHFLSMTFSDRRGRKPFTLGVVCFVVAALTTNTIRGLWQRRSDAGFYLLGTVVSVALCLGPVGRVFGQWLIEKPPYFWLMKLPGGEALRVPTRFATLVSLCLAMAAALALGRMSRDLSGSRRRVVVATIVAVIVCDCWPRPLAMEAAPARIELPAACRSSAVLELPMGTVVTDASAMYRSIFHGRAVVNGYSGYSPTPYNVLSRAVSEYDESILPSLAEFGSLCIIIDGSVTDANAYERMALRAGATRCGSSEHRALYLVRKHPSTLKTASSTLPVSSTDDEHGGVCPKCATDGSEDTRWSSRESQRVSHILQLTLAETQDVSGLRLSMRAVAGDYPRRLTIDTSSDGVTWQTQWQGLTAGTLYRAIVLDERSPEITISFQPVRAKYVIVRQEPAPNVRHNWSVAEIRVLR